MLIIELLSERTWADIEQDQSFPPELKQTAKDARASGRELKGAGTTAFVTHKADPHDITTVRRHTSKLYDDGFRAYADAILATPSIKNNPYIPRIKAITEKGEVVEYEIEKLSQFYDPRIASLPMLQSQINVWFTDTSKSYFKKYMDSFAGEDITEDELASLWAEAISNLLADAVGDPAYINIYIKDTKLREALLFIRSVVQHAKTRTPPVYLDYDIHDGNVMWRMTGKMPQLVITDPLI